jgi:hypothetical protein
LGGGLGCTGQRVPPDGLSPIFSRPNARGAACLLIQFGLDSLEQFAKEENAAYDAKVSLLEDKLKEADVVVMAAFSMTKKLTEGHIMAVTDYNASLHAYLAATGPAPADEIIDLDSDHGEMEVVDQYVVEELDPPPVPYPPPSPKSEMPSYVLDDEQFNEVRNVVHSILLYRDENYDINLLDVGAIWL